jgi:DNA-binding LacI/PurR family transcriptional regulator
MTKKALQATLTELRAELEQTDTLDEATRHQLNEIADEIEHVLDQNAPDYESAQARVEAATLRFEAEHPYFARILSEVTDALSKLGI